MEWQTNIQLPSMFFVLEIGDAPMSQKNKHMTSFYAFVLESKDAPMNVTEPDKTNALQFVDLSH